MNIELLTPALGAEIDIDLGNITPQDAQAVYDALMAHQVVFFRNQTMTPEQHITLAGHFGEIDVPHPIYQNHPVIPAITVLENDADHPPDTNDWHKDLTFRESPPFMSILYAKKVPETGGDTLWANMALAYDRLTPHLRTMLETLEAVHDIGCFRNDYLGADSNINAMNEGVRNNGAWVHPVVDTHPVTGAKYINVNRSFTQHIVGLLKAESDRLLQYLYSHIDQPEHQVRFRWRDHSVAIWDNRVTQHYALADYLPGYRCMNRVTVTSDRRATS
ncbi:TauD/TfdA family dioxygenase [Luminiphilus sp.]|nr:TauD/TfdA family dioxygenase [Luminiphilus sp.]MDA8946751.1 TauD/TfdA family dioxygenase [Luminiphilus sp.]MDB2623031.1 TauD/TfdA family dioxygenase [Luminiphilus sp.]